MRLREFVEIAADAAEIAGVVLIVGGLFIAIRTFLSWSLALELDGRWPWQRAAESIPSTH